MPHPFAAVSLMQFHATATAPPPGAWQWRKAQWRAVRKLERQVGPDNDLSPCGWPAP